MHLKFGLALFTLVAIVVGSVVLAEGPAEGPAEGLAEGPAVESGTDRASLRVVPRTSELQLFPCSQCHSAFPPDNARRQVTAHPGPFVHGGDRIWCLDCHDAEQRDTLIAGDGAPRTFDESSEICATCHSERFRDWQGGAHGKSKGNWQGERLVYGCVQCHDPHDPSIKPRPPSPPPSIRRGLEPTRTDRDAWRPSWESTEEETNR